MIERNEIITKKKKKMEFHIRKMKIMKIIKCKWIIIKIMKNRRIPLYYNETNEVIELH